MDTALQLSGAAKIARPGVDRAVCERPMALVVDPSAEQRHVAARGLLLAGYVVHEASDATEALRVLRTASPDLIVTGVSMDGPCDGIGLCDIVRSQPRLRHCAVVITTGRTDADRLRRIDEAGAKAALAQPFNPSQLVAAVDGAGRQGEPGLLALAAGRASVAGLAASRPRPE